MESTLSPQTMTSVDLDHTSFAVNDVMSWAQRLRRELGATPISGEVLPAFRYLLLYIGSPEQRARMELMEPVDPGFLTRFLSKRGEGPHHITFSVPDLRAAVEGVKSLGLTVVGESYRHSPWCEAFILPDTTHSVVIQLAQSDREYPTPEGLLTTRTRDTASFPSAEGGTEPLWWKSLWETPAGELAELGTTHLASRDLSFSRHLFEGVLGGSVQEGQDYLDFSWDSGSVRVHYAEKPGVIGMSLQNKSEELWIGSAWVGARG